MVAVGIIEVVGDVAEWNVDVGMVIMGIVPVMIIISMWDINMGVVIMWIIPMMEIISMWDILIWGIEVLWSVIIILVRRICMTV